MKIKICGIFRECDIDYINESMPDFAGFVFAKSKRQISFDKAKHLKSKLSGDIKAVGVFADEEIKIVQKAVYEGIIDIVQLHGNENESYIERINAPVIKAVRLGEKIPENADYILFDSDIAGSGTAFDWALIPKTNKPFFIAGGIDIKNIGRAKLLNPFGIDISSGVETNGVKDKEKIKDIVRSVRDD